MAFGCFKPAVVLEGIRARFLERKGGAGADRACAGSIPGKGHSAAIGCWPTPFLARAYRPGQELLKRPGARYAEPLPRRVSGPAGAL